EALQQLERDEEALSTFAAVIRRVPSAEVADASARPRNKYLDLTGARQFVEAACTKWLEAGKNETARELATIYRANAPPGESARRVALACEAMGMAAMRESEKCVGTDAERLTRRAHQDFAAAGDAFADAASERLQNSDRIEMLWSAAQNWLHGQEYAKAVPLLEQLRSIEAMEESGQGASLSNMPSPTLVELLVALAEANLGQANQVDDELGKKPLLDKSLQTLQEALPRPSPAAIVVRGKYLLGLVRVERREWPEAEAAFRDVVTMPLLAPEPMERRQALFALGWLLYQSEQYLDAARYFRDA